MIHMQKISLITAGLVAFSLAVTAQKINTDSLSLVSKISEYQLKRAKLLNTVKQTTWNKQDDSLKVQNSANKNSEDASRLASDPQNKQLAKKADNAASDARQDSKNARHSNRKLDNLNKEIAKLGDKIADAQIKLDFYTGMSTPVAVPVTMPLVTPVVADSSRHS
jgi:uncharacterized protein involved in exopolysaccharide biosynthesis